MNSLERCYYNQFSKKEVLWIDSVSVKLIIREEFNIVPDYEIKNYYGDGDDKVITRVLDWSKFTNHTIHSYEVIALNYCDKHFKEQKQINLYTLDVLLERLCYFGKIQEGIYIIECEW